MEHQYNNYDLQMQHDEPPIAYSQTVHQQYPYIHKDVNHYNYDHQHYHHQQQQQQPDGIDYYSANSVNPSSGLYCNYLGQSNHDCSAPTYSYRLSPNQSLSLMNHDQANQSSDHQQPGQHHYHDQQPPAPTSTTSEYNSSQSTGYNPPPSSMYYPSHRGKSSPPINMGYHIGGGGREQLENGLNYNQNFTITNSYDIPPSSAIHDQDQESYHSQQQYLAPHQPPPPPLAAPCTGYQEPIANQIDLARSSNGNCNRDTYNTGSLYLADYVGSHQRQHHHQVVPSVSLSVSSNHHLNHRHHHHHHYDGEPMDQNHQHYQDCYSTNYKLEQQENDFFTTANDVILANHHHHNHVGGSNERLVTLRLEQRTMSISTTSEEISEHLLTTQNLNRGQPSTTMWSEVLYNGPIAATTGSGSNREAPIINGGSTDQGANIICSSSSLGSASQFSSNGCTSLTTKTTTATMNALLNDDHCHDHNASGGNEQPQQFSLINNNNQFNPANQQTECVSNSLSSVSTSTNSNHSTSSQANQIGANTNTNMKQQLKLTIKHYRDRTTTSSASSTSSTAAYHQARIRGATKKALVGMIYNHLAQPSTTIKANQCDVCGRDYARPSTLKTHLRTHTNERPFRCQICHKTFSQAANLTAHHRIHTGERPFSCPICSRKFSQSSSVITHLRTHSGERPYRCTSCSKTFSDSSTLTKHCRIHSGEKPYQCAHCPLNFSQSGNLSRHLKLHIHNNSGNNSKDTNRDNNNNDNNSNNNNSKSNNNRSAK